MLGRVVVRKILAWRNGKGKVEKVVERCRCLIVVRLYNAV